MGGCWPQPQPAPPAPTDIAVPGSATWSHARLQRELAEVQAAQARAEARIQRVQLERAQLALERAQIRESLAVSRRGRVEEEEVEEEEK